MGYIRDEGHLINFVNKFLREGGVEYESLPTAKELVDKIWNTGIADRFTWVLVRENPEVLCDLDSFMHFELNGSSKKTIGDLKRYIKGSYRYSHEFITECEKLINKPGVYSFWSKRTALYVGTSISLCDRITSSFNGRLPNLGNPEDISLRYIISKTKSDSTVLEAYMISKLKPKLNVTGRYEDELTLIIKSQNWSKYIKCLESRHD